MILNVFESILLLPIFLRTSVIWMYNSVYMFLREKNIDMFQLRTVVKLVVKTVKWFYQSYAFVMRFFIVQIKTVIDRRRWNVRKRRNFNLQFNKPKQKHIMMYNCQHCMNVWLLFAFLHEINVNITSLKHH